MPTRRGSYVATAPAGAVGRAGPIDSAMRDTVNVGDAVEGRESFEEDHAIPVKVLASDFESAAVMPPPPPRPAPKAAAPEESLAVFCRLRPLGKGECGGVIEVTDAKTVRSAPPAQSTRHASNHVRREARDYTFTRVFDAEATQAEVYEATTAPLVDALFSGRSALLFTYGVTNAGKSHTMMGRPEDEAARGLMPRALDLILERAEAQGGEVRLSFMEIYNENVYDLMDKEAAVTRKRRALRVKDRGHSMEVANLGSVKVTSAAHGLAMAKAAQAQRKTSSTGLNKTSSRSHSICQLEVVGEAGEKGAVLMLVDLAGSERIDRTGATATGAQQKEANHINQSIMRLMNCLRVVREKQAGGAHSREVVPWRDSKLTHLFQYLLAPPNGGLVARVSMIVNVSPSVGDHNESTYVMSNAAQAKAVAIVRAPPDAKGDKGKMFATYDANGRRVYAAAPPATDAAAAAAATESKKRKTDKSAEQLQLESASECSRSQASDVTFDEAALSSAGTLALEAEVAALKEALAVAHQRVSVVEREVRDECAEEMGETIARIQSDYARRLARNSSIVGPHPGAKNGGGGDDDDDDAAASEDGDDDDDDDAMDEEAAAPAAARADAWDDIFKSARKEKQKDELENYVVDLEMQFQETEEELERVRAEKDEECAKLRAQLAAAQRGGGANPANPFVDGDGDAAMGDADAWVARADHEAALKRVEQLERDVAAAREETSALSAELESARAAAADARDELDARDEAEADAADALKAAHAREVDAARAREAETRAQCDTAVAAAHEVARVAKEREAEMAKQAQADADAAAAATARAKRAEDRAADADKALALAKSAAPPPTPIYADVPGAHEATACLDALKAQSAKKSPRPEKSPGKSTKKGVSPRVPPASASGGEARVSFVLRGPEDPGVPHRRSPLKENSPVVRAVKSAVSSPKRAVQAVASSLDARARKIKDERIARAKAQRAGQTPSTDVPVAKRTRGYKIL